LSLKRKSAFLFIIFLFISCAKTGGNFTSDSYSVPENRIATRLVVQICYAISWTQCVASINFRSIVPSTIIDRQIINNIEYTHKPITISRNDGNTYADFEISTNPEINGELELILDCDVSIINFDRKKNKAWRGAERQKIFRNPAGKIENNPMIKELALSLKAETPLLTVQKIHRYVRSQITQIEYNTELSIAEILVLHKGDCTEYSTLTASLLRASGIPTMMVYGITTESGEFHSWNEVYIKKYGWLVVDTTDKNENYFYPVQGNLYLANKSYEDSKLKLFSYYVYEYTRKLENAEAHVKISSKIKTRMAP